MKTPNCLIVLLSVLCLAGCKFDGSLRYEQYDLDASKASKVSFDIPWARIDEKVPLIEWVKIVPNESSLYLKLKGKVPRKYAYAAYFDSSDKKIGDSWSGFESATNERISGVSFGLCWTSIDVASLMTVIGYSDDDVDEARQRLDKAKYPHGRDPLNPYQSGQKGNMMEIINANSNLRKVIEVKAEKMLPLLDSILNYHQSGNATRSETSFTTECKTMLIHIDTDSEYDGWYFYPIKEHNTYRNPQFPPEKKSYF